MQRVTARYLLIAAVVSLLVIGWLAPAWAEAADEEKIGKEACAQLEKEVKVVDDAAETARLTAITNKLGAVSERPEVKYSVKILESKEINAFSIPGGHIYITQGALKSVESEDELAAILAHEVAHNAKKHALESIKREAKAQRQLALGLLAAILGGQRVDAGNVMLVGTLLKAAVVNSYSVKAETQADDGGLLYLRKAGYNPVAMLTVVEGLAKMEYSRPHVEAGVLQTHPYGEERMKNVREQLVALGIPINRRPVLQSLIPSVEPAPDSKDVGVLKVDKTTLLNVAPADGRTGVERARTMADALSKVFLANAQIYEFGPTPAASGVDITARNTPLIHVLPEDAKLAGAANPKALAGKVLENLRVAFWQDSVKRGF